MRGTARLCDAEKRTVLNLLVLAGENCERLFSERVRNVKISQLQADEIWTFVQKKEGHKFPHEAHAKEIGDAYTFIGLDRTSKLVCSMASWQTRPGEHGRFHFQGSVDHGR